MRVDQLQLGENLLQVRKLADMPKMIKKVDLLKVQAYYIEELKKLKAEIWKK
jgi:hypothetical protein